MPRIVTPNVEAVPEAARPALTPTQKKIGRIPNLFRVVANGPAALNGHLGLSNARAPRVVRRRVDASPSGPHLPGNPELLISARSQF